MGLLSCVSQKFVGDWEGSQLGQVTPKGNFTPSEDHAQCSELPGRVWFGEGAGIAQQVVSSYIMHQLFGWVFQFLFLTSLLAMLLYFILFPIIKLLFSQPANSTSDSPPHSTGVREKRRGLSGFAVLHFHLGLPRAPVLQSLPCLHCPPLPQPRELWLGEPCAIFSRKMRSGMWLEGLQAAV